MKHSRIAIGLTALALAFIQSGCLSHPSKRSSSKLRIQGVGANGHLQYFGFYGDIMDETNGFTNITTNLGIEHYDSSGVLAPDMEKAEKLGLKYIYLAWAPGVAAKDKPWTPPPAAEWEAFKRVLQPHLPYIVAFNLADEPTCGLAADDPACRQLNANYEAYIDFMHANFPGKPMWIDYYGTINELGIADGDFSRIANLPGFRKIDWISFDVYDSVFDKFICANAQGGVSPVHADTNCTNSGPFRQKSLPDLVNQIKRYKRPDQKILLVPQGWYNTDPSKGLNESETLTLIDRMFQYAVSEPEIIGILPFTYSEGAKKFPSLLAKYKEIGQAISGKNGSTPSTPATPVTTRTPSTVPLTPSPPPAPPVASVPAHACPVVDGIDGVGECGQWAFVSCSSGGYNRARSCAAGSQCRTTDFNGNGTPINPGGEVIDCGQGGKLSCPIVDGIDGVGVCQPWTLSQCGPWGTYTRVRTCDQRYDCRTSDINGAGTPVNIGEPGNTSCP